VWRKGWRSLVLANLVGSVLVTAYLETTSLPSRHPFAHQRLFAGNNGDLFLISTYVLVLWVGGYYLSRRVFRATTAWLLVGREPDADEAKATLRLPQRAAAAYLVIWSGVGILSAAANYATHDSVGLALRIAVGVAAAGVVVALTASLLVERALRPVYVYVFRGQPPSRDRIIGIRRRLLLFWTLGSGLPLLGILVTPFGLPGNDKDKIFAGMLVLAACGLVAGFAATVVAATSIADPVTDVRQAMRRVAAGDLDAEVPVDDDGEMGLLQAGFNHMAEGLRERERMRELFGGYVGEEVARHALESGVSLEGAERDVSVLFVDVVGSTALAERRPPVEVVALLNRFFDVVIAAVADEEGWVNKFEGDAALCVFGAPMQQADHAARALRSAVAMRNALLGIEGLDAGIGVSSGIAVAGNVGSARRYEYTVVGDPVNEAARLTELAKAHAGRIVVSERTVMAAGASNDGWQPSECITLRGRSRPTQTFVPA